jgi:hypothetical protein
MAERSKKHRNIFNYFLVLAGFFSMISSFSGFHGFSQIQMCFYSVFKGFRAFLRFVSDPDGKIRGMKNVQKNSTKTRIKEYYAPQVSAPLLPRPPV